MLKKITKTAFLVLVFSLMVSFNKETNSPYYNLYFKQIELFEKSQHKLINSIENRKLNNNDSKQLVLVEIKECRKNLKMLDFWFRYFEPNDYKKINGPLPVEWETEVFEKFEKPYKREGAGLTIAELYLEEKNATNDSLKTLINQSLKATLNYKQEVITKNLKSFDSFYLCNRLYLLNIATIYTTGFECPNKEQIIPELCTMLVDVNGIYDAFNSSFPDKKISIEYQELYNQTIKFVENQPKNSDKFNHFIFIRDYINPLYALNQQLIQKYDVVSTSNLDFTLSNTATSIFDKSLYFAQNSKGIFSKIDDQKSLHELDSIGKLLFYDPILSSNNRRSCVSCHKTDNFLTDNSTQTALQFNNVDFLTRNTPSLVNVKHNHLLMIDGKHLDLQEQGKAVITNPIEMGSNEKEVLQKILSCSVYKDAFEKLSKKTISPNEIIFDHIVSSITYYYSKFSNYYSPFDDAINYKKPIDEKVVNGYNLFMSKAQCATCHFAPTFSGIKPPYIGNEFEVIGVPNTKNDSLNISKDSGRYGINSAVETHNAFRTTTIRNIDKTKPYMHNGIYKTLEEVVDFYDGGGGKGHGMKVENQTLAADSLKLSKIEKKELISFLKSLTEDVKFEKPPTSLPSSKHKKLNARKVGGEY